MKAIRAKAGMPLTLYFAVVMIAAGTVIGYWNELIFVTLVIAAVAQLLRRCGEVDLYKDLLRRNGREYKEMGVRVPRTVLRGTCAGGACVPGFQV